ncbi:MAG: transglutaminase-like domain-containing protein [Candidatus Hydrothermia bacterium]
MNQFVLLSLIFFSQSTTDTSWYSLYLMGNKVGYTQVIREEQKNGYRIGEITYMNVKMLGTSKTVLLKSNYFTDGDFKMKKFDFEMSTQDQQLKGAGFIKGDTLFVNYSSSSGAPIEKKMFIQGDLFSETTLRMFLEKKKPTKVSCSIFDVATATLQDAICELEESKNGLLKYKLNSQGTTSTLLLKNGRFEREEGPMGIVVQRETKSSSQELGTEIDITELYAVKPNKKIEATSYLKLKVAGNISGLNFNLGPQKVIEKGNNFVILEINKDHAKCSSLVIPDSVKVYLEPDPYVQSDSKDIQMLAKSITGKIQDPCKKVAAINEWLKGNIVKAPSVTVPTALDVIRERRGDCNEHAVLFTALARASGIPADIVAGLIYQDGAYYYHAWAMVYIGNKWVFVDPIFNEFPASLNHIAMTRGSLEKQSEIMQAAGSLKILVEAQK